MSCNAVNCGFGSMECYFPGVKVYLDSAGPVDPYAGQGLFRGEECFDGSLNGWRRWTRPSPEPAPDPALNAILMDSMRKKSVSIAALHDILLERILTRAGNQPVLLVAILRAGVFISAGLAARARICRGLDIPVAALGLFHEAGLDGAAWQQIRADYPDRMPVLVDGWTGRGVAAGEIRRSLACGSASAGHMREWPIATLVDPGHYGDLWATDRDTLMDCAHFSAPEVLGFSRAFITAPDRPWQAYDYPPDYRNQDLIDAWMGIFTRPVEAGFAGESEETQNLQELLQELTAYTGVPARDWKVNSNEVARTFVNREPRALLLGLPETRAREEMPAFIYLAGKHHVPVEFVPWMNENYHCLAAVRLR